MEANEVRDRKDEHKRKATNLKIISAGSSNAEFT